ncbi:MAG: energy-coupling factor ABC transporter permease [Desulfuromonadales bacterium]
MTRRLSLLVPVLYAFTTGPAFAMHITEGLLPLPAVLLWFGLVGPFLIAGIILIGRRKAEIPEYMPLLGIFGAAVFVFSCLPIPIPGIGATAHPAGTGLSAIFVGPFPSVVVAFVSLLLQGTFLAHGGLSTLGANTFSMGVLGAFAGYSAFRISRMLRLNLFWCGFAAGACADIFTYLGTSFGLASGLHGTGSYLGEVRTIFFLLSPYVVVLALIEGLVTGGILFYIGNNRPDLLRRIGILPKENRR